MTVFIIKLPPPVVPPQAPKAPEGPSLPGGGISIPPATFGLGTASGFSGVQLRTTDRSEVVVNAQQDRATSSPAAEFLQAPPK